MKPPSRETKGSPNSSPSSTAVSSTPVENPVSAQMKSKGNDSGEVDHKDNDYGQWFTQQNMLKIITVATGYHDHWLDFK